MSKLDDERLDVESLDKCTTDYGKIGSPDVDILDIESLDECTIDRDRVAKSGSTDDTRLCRIPR